MNTLLTIVVAIGTAVELWGLVITLSAHGNMNELERGSSLMAFGATVVAGAACIKVVTGCFM